MRYIPLKAAERKAMLETIGANSVEGLFASIPASVRFTKTPDIPKGKTESELRAFFGHCSAKNEGTPGKGWMSYLGAGAYEHFIPAVVDALSFRGEFETAYTPYQPEVSQGTLQAIFEFQSLIANLFEMDVANASMYDGASALAEAVVMAMRVKRSSRVYLSKGIHPDYRRIIESYLAGSDATLVDLDLDSAGRTVVPAIEKGTAAVVVQQPNFFGVVETLESLGEKIHAAEALFVVGTTEAMAFGRLKGPGSQGADIVAGEGQSFGNAMSYGGPHVGLFATKNKFLRQLPGRLVGRTVDRDGNDGYVLTLATREQHIRRDKATSNICTNHSLCALRACIYLSTVGGRGLQEVATRNAYLTQRLRVGLLKCKGITSVYDGPVFNEFTVRLPISAEQFVKKLQEEKILAGIPLIRWDNKRENELLIAVTETKQEADIDRFLDVAGRVL